MILDGISQLTSAHGIKFDDPWDYVLKFEAMVASYCGAEYAVATDSCTHAVELSLRYTKPSFVVLPSHTYISIPMAIAKCGIPFEFHEGQWERYYWLQGAKTIDGAVHFDRNCYVRDSFYCLSFQSKKRIPLGRGGAILTDDPEAYRVLKKMVYDGRNMPKAWKSDLDKLCFGYHYYMTPETAATGIHYMLDNAVRPYTKSSWSDYADLRSSVAVDRLVA